AGMVVAEGAEHRGAAAGSGLNGLHLAGLAGKVGHHRPAVVQPGIELVVAPDLDHVPPLVVELDAEQPDIAQACPDRPLLYGRQEAPGERGGGG
ncbi:hypothetical protein, partial [Pararcticibacter amylolyticus]|uniref:hypothetical protein n=1 Tax=Pararcticibacter amylolyticus TaxID=2173175 RepID=UPI001304CDA5